MSYRTATHIWTVILDFVGCLKKKTFSGDIHMGSGYRQELGGGNGGVDVIIFVCTHEFSKTGGDN